MCLAYQPQQSVLYPHDGQRHTACMRNISVPHRSQSTLSDEDTGFRQAGCGVGASGLMGSAMSHDYMTRSARPSGVVFSDWH
jgi:hypothetical protein